MRRVAPVLIVLSVLTALPALVSPGIAAERVLLLRAARAVLGGGGEIAPAAVLIRGDRIEAVGEKLDAPEGAQVVELRDSVLTPGLIDAHAYLDLEAGLSEPLRVATPEFRARDAGRPGEEALAKQRADGVTACLVAPNDRNIVGGRPILLLTDGTPLGEPEAVKACLSAPAINTTRFPSTRWGALEILRSCAPIRNTPLHLSVNNAADVRAALTLLGERKREGDVLVGAADAFEVVEDVPATGVPATGVPATGVPATGVPATGAAVVWGPVKTTWSPRRVRGAAVLANAGVSLAFGTADLPGSLRRTAVMAHRAGLSREATIRALCVNGAAIVGAGAEIGRLAKGRRADLVVFDGDPLDLSSKPVRLFVGGREVPVTPKENGR